MSYTAFKGPGEWTIMGGDFGFEIRRALGDYRSEWLKDSDGRELVFDTREEAHTYLEGIKG